MFGGSGVEADVMEAPVVPLFAFEDRLGVVERRERFLSVVALSVVIAKVDQRISFRLGDVIRLGNLGAFLVVGDGLIEVSAFQVTPDTRVGHPPETAVIVSAPDNLTGLL